MKRGLLLTTIYFLSALTLVRAQNVFDAADPITRYNAGSPLGSANNPNPNTSGLQKWVSVPTTGISTGSGAWDNSSFKAYYINQNGRKMAFRVKYPKTYTQDPTKKYPIFLFFHGAGEVACPTNGGVYNNEKQLVHGGKLFRDRVDNGQFDGFLIYPQRVSTSSCFGNWPGAPSNDHLAVINFIDSLGKYARADIDRVLVAGLSSGGSAAWSMAAAYPQRITKATPSAAAAGNFNFPQFVHIPIWFATGAKDTNPSPGTGTSSYNKVKTIGGDIIYTLYPDLGHGVWNAHWQEPNYVPYMNEMHKANPLVYFQRYEYCPEDVFTVRIGVTGGFAAYEWMKDGVKIDTAKGNEIIVNTFGTYSVRFRRSANGAWSEWSPKPAQIKQKPVTQTPTPTVQALRSNVVPAPDGSTTAPLTLPDGFAAYNWYRASDNVKVATTQVYNAPPGEYKAQVVEEFGCGTLFSPSVKVIDANGTPKPEPAKSLTAFANAQTTVQLDWSQHPNPGSNETGFEIYRGVKEGGPYSLVHVTAPDVISYLDKNLTPNTPYYYVVRAISATGASAVSNEANSKTLVDNSAPTGPANVRYWGSTLNSVTLRWSAQQDNVGVSRYDIYVNGTKMFSTKDTIATVFGLDSLTTYSFIVKAVDNLGNTSAPSNQVLGYTHRQGLNYNYYNGQFNNLPDYNSLTPNKSGITDDVTNGLGIRTQNDNFAMIWRGYIYIPENGNYVFETYSDDGSKLYIDVPYSFSATATVNNDGQHGTQFRSSASIALTKGYHLFTATYFERTGGDVMQVYWSSANAGVPRSIIPSGFLARDNVNPITSINAPSGLSVTQNGYSKLNLSWTDNSSEETNFELIRGTAVNGPFVAVGSVGANITSYTDTLLNPSTQYFYRVRAVSGTALSSYAAASGTTGTVPGAPAQPIDPTAAILTSNSITIGFTDNSDSETGFEIWRGVGSDQPNAFKLLAKLPAGSGETYNYIDSGLFANVTFYYKVRATGETMASNYTSIVSARTLNTAPDIANITDVTMKFGTTLSVPVSAADPDGDVLVFSSSDLPPFAHIEPGTNGNANLVFAAGSLYQGVYTITVAVDDGNDGKDSTYFTLVVNDNDAPTFEPIQNVTMTEGQTISVPLAAADEEGSEYVSWLFEGLPAFASFSNTGNGTGNLNFNAGYASAGLYTIKAIADDGFGGKASQEFTLVVDEVNPNETIRIRLRVNTAAPALWNDVQLSSTNPAAQFSVSNLKNLKNEVTTVGINSISGTFGPSQQAPQPTNNTGIYPNSILRDHISWGNGSANANNVRDTVRLRVFGLDPTRRYNFSFFGSEACGGCGIVNTTKTTFKIDNEIAEVRHYQNTSHTDTIYQVLPNASGEVFITAIGDPFSTYGGALNAIVIDKQFDDGTTPARPLDLKAQHIPNSGNKLTWLDKSFNENNYLVYRSLSQTGPFTQINTTGNWRDSVSYLDPQVAPLTKYYYFVAGVNTNGIGAKSDTVSILTGNNLPIVNSPANIYVKVDSLREWNFTVVDDASDQVTVSLQNQPSFVTLSSLGSNNYRISALPSIADLGYYEFQVYAIDDKGASSVKTVTLNVSNKNVKTVYINFGSSTKSAPLPWNNWLGFRNANQTLTGLKDHNNQAVVFQLKSLTRWVGVTDIGHITGNNSGVVPDAVLTSGISSDSLPARKFTFTGLNNSMKYNLTFITSQNEGYDATSEFRVGSKADTVNGRNNTRQTANINGIVPVNGEITFEVKRLGLYSYLNGVILEEYEPAAANPAPTSLYAEPASKTSVRLTWSDKAEAENLADGYRVERSTDPGFGSVTSVDLAGYQSTYLATGLSPNTKYWFRVRSKTGATYSDYSNAAETITPQSQVFINFNFAVPSAPAPWNNMESLPNTVETYSGFNDESGNATGLTLTIEKIFNGEFNAGKQTGNNSGVVPDNVLAANYWLDNTQLGQMRITGLNHTKRYRFGFFGSAGPEGWTKGNYTATYTINNRTVYLNAWENTSKIVYIGDVVPDINGEVMLNFSTTTTAAYAFNGGVIIESYNDGEGGVVPNRMLITADESQLVNEARITTAQALDNFGIRTYPNPFRDLINLQFTNNSSTNLISVEIYDLAGRLALRKQFGKLSAGYQTLRINGETSKLAPGVYMVNLSINGKPVQAGKMIKSYR